MKKLVNWYCRCCRDWIWRDLKDDEQKEQIEKEYDLFHENLNKKVKKRPKPITDTDLDKMAFFATTLLDKYSDNNHTFIEIGVTNKKRIPQIIKAIEKKSNRKVYYFHCFFEYEIARKENSEWVHYLVPTKYLKSIKVRYEQ